MMNILVTDKQRGKTTELMNWVLGGHKTHRYPFWSRVAVVPSVVIHDRVKSEWWDKIEDFDHRVFYLMEIKNNRNFNYRETEVRFDDMDIVLSILLPFTRIDGFTITANQWNAGE